MCVAGGNVVVGAGDRVVPTEPSHGSWPSAGSKWTLGEVDITRLALRPNA